MVGPKSQVELNLYQIVVARNRTVYLIESEVGKNLGVCRPVASLRLTTYQGGQDKADGSCRLVMVPEERSLQGRPRCRVMRWVATLV